MKENSRMEKKKEKEKFFIKIMEIGTKEGLKMIILMEGGIMYGIKMDMNILVIIKMELLMGMVFLNMEIKLYIKGNLKMD